MARWNGAMRVKGMPAEQIFQGVRLAQPSPKGRDFADWAAPRLSPQEVAFQGRVNALSAELMAESARDLTKGIERALNVLVSGLSASAAAFYTPTPRASLHAGSSAQLIFKRLQTGSAEGLDSEIHPMPGVSAERSGASLPAEFDLRRLPDRGEGLLAGQAQRVLCPQTALRWQSRVVRDSIGMAETRSVQRLSHAVLVIPCTGPGGLLGILRVDGGLASKRGQESVLASASFLGTLVAYFIERNRREFELESLRQSRAQSDRLETLGRVATSVAHDFNNVLTAIGGNAELLEMSLPEDAKELTEVREIAEASARAADLVEEVLSFGRVRDESVRPVSLAELIASLGPITQRVAGNGMDVRVAIDPDLPLIEVNPSRFERVLLNLASNARDAQPENRSCAGVLSLSARRVHVSALRIREDFGPLPSRGGDRVPEALSAGDYLCLRVEDDGCGMDLSVQERVFEAFFTTKGESSGTGLGLATCSEVMREVGGALTVESAPGEGTAFDLYFPLAV